MSKWVAAVGLVLLAVEASAGETPVLKTQQEQMSYALGVQFGRHVKQQGVEVEAEALLNGVRAGLSGETPLLSDEDLGNLMVVYKNEAKRREIATRGKQAKATSALAEENKKKGEEFLAENKTKPGVVTLPSGLQYTILKEGDGKRPTDADTVKLHYRGTLISGAEFANTYAKGQPRTFPLSGVMVIPGWREALKLMPVGSKWQLFIPPQLAYGDKGAGPMIKPNATIIYELELLGIK